MSRSTSPAIPPCEADNLRKACLPAGTSSSRSRGYVPIEGSSRCATGACRRSTRRRPHLDTNRWTTSGRSASKPVFRLTTVDRLLDRGTADHPFLVEDRGHALGEIRPGDLVGVVGAHPHRMAAPRSATPRSTLAALLISEGYIPDVRDDHRGRRHFANTDPELLDAFRDRISKCHFGRPHGVGVHHRRCHRSCTLRPEEVRELEPVLGSFGLAGDKTIPDCVVNAAAGKVERFLGLYFCADGWADRVGDALRVQEPRRVPALKRMLLRCGDAVATSTTATSRVTDATGRCRSPTRARPRCSRRSIGPYLTDDQDDKVMRWADRVGRRSSATNIGIPTSFVAG